MTAAPQEAAAAAAADDDLWVFGYGSLMWNPGFDVAETVDAYVCDYRRSFCLWSERYRGTPERPGLVLGLTWAPGARTRGLAFRVVAEKARAVRMYLTDRELVTRAYREVMAELAPAGPAPTPARALTFVIDATHPQYAGDLTLPQQAEIIAGAAGARGANDAYLFNTVAHLEALGLTEAEIDDLAELARLVRQKRAARNPAM